MAAGPSLDRALHYPPPSAPLGLQATPQPSWDCRLAWQNPPLNASAKVVREELAFLAGAVRFAQEDPALEISWFRSLFVHPVPSGEQPADCRCPWQSFL